MTSATDTTPEVLPAAGAAPGSIFPAASPEAVLFQKLARVMGEIDRVPKTGRNDFHGYDFVTEASLVEAVRGKLAEANVALIPSLTSITEREYTTERSKQSVVTTAHVAFTFVDGDTGAMFRADWAGQGDDPSDKGLYSAYTGALKYFLMKTFLIPTGDDPEGNAASDLRGQDRAKSTARSPAKPGGEPSDAQKGFLTKLITQKKATLEQLRIMLVQVGAPEVGLKQGTAGPEIQMDKLTAGRDGTCSALIDWLQTKPLPDPEHPSDVPVAEDDFAPPVDADRNEIEW